jgi:hypothetical protein
MGAARLLAKFWIAFCVFAGAHALVRALAQHMQPEQAVSLIGMCVVLFGAMGLLFVAGYGAASGGFSKLTASAFLPGFNEIVFIAFAAAIFTVQLVSASGQPPTGAMGALASAMHFAIPGQRALETALAVCGKDMGATFASATSWLLAFIFIGSSFSRLRLQAGLMRLERKARAQARGATPLTFMLGLIAVIGIQLLFVGGIYPLIPCGMLVGLPGEVLIGLGPLALAYLIVAALTNLLALSPEA